MHTLDPLPDHIGPLSPNSAYEALVKREPGMWRGPQSKACPTCLGKGTFVRYSRSSGKTAEYKCDCAAQWILYVHLLNSGLQVGHQKICWDDVDSQVADEVIDDVVGYVEHAEQNMRSGRSMVLRGTNGTGKTMLAILVMKGLIRHGYDCRFVGFTDLLDSYTGAWKKEEDKALYRRYLSADFLVIDEVHARTVGGMQHVGETMFDHLLRSRTSADRPTILTTNLTMDEVATGYGRSIANLLTESYTVIEVTGVSYRDKANAHKQAEWKVNAARPLVLR